jgi:hypothetical protein
MQLIIFAMVIFNLEKIKTDLKEKNKNMLLKFKLKTTVHLLNHVL